MKNTTKHTEYFKRLAIKRIKQRQESDKIYPISKRDLLYLKKCPLCKNAKLEVISEVYLKGRLNFFTTAICSKCLFIFRTISPKFSWFKKCWTTIRSDKIQVFNPRAEKYKLKRYKIYQKLISKYVSKGKLLDIGASYGTGSSVFKNMGFIVNAIEAEENKIKYLKEQLQIPVVGTSIELSIISKKTKQKYDVAIFSNCLEHLDFPIPVIAKMENFLKPTGVMLLAIPHIWDSINWSDALYLTHKSNFTTENMLKLLAKNNFEILEMIRIPFFQEIVFIIRKMSGKNQIPRHKEQRPTITKIKLLYRKDLPLKKSPPLSAKIKYKVPHIDQFFQTVNLDKKIPTWEDNWVNFISK